MEEVKETPMAPLVGELGAESIETLKAEHGDIYRDRFAYNSIRCRTTKGVVITNIV